ncbi:ImmA/IrrE family metallo-endopeptidase [Actinoplanes sp. TBRC 11911]|uniref:helix-turn-helix domain-containing protein n=1 Tax=Actinoplanes sp. TBRC 11911 TaxID=2729386 RepID=UPI00145EE162|nr:XRE family transcriptional regulator [Actinoplanes sp. TBRC 11911]NMO54269.1 ImmA/IrrE family metallo-endopeptidase [Actinoplanes sp. TBRC 11911]
MIYGERVKQVRELQHLTQSALASMIPELTQYQLSRIESGATVPNAEMIAMIAGSLGVTVEFFERRPSHDFEAMSPQLRARSSRLTQGVKSSAMQWARLVLEEYTRLQGFGKPIPVRLERFPSVPPRDAAAAVRLLLGFSRDLPLPYLILAIERLGVVTLGLPYSAQALDAFCAWYGEIPVIALLTGVPGDRLRWSVAHELGHLVLHQRGDRGKDIEAEADEFAAELLTPQVAIADAMPTVITLNSLTMLKTQWGVSIKSLIRRARELGFVDQDRATSLYKQVSARGWNKSEPGYVPREKPRAFRKLAEIGYGAGPNVEGLAKDAAWSQELALQVLDEHAAPDELPMEPQSAPAPQHGGNVVAFRRPIRNTDHGSSTFRRA